MTDTNNPFCGEVLRGKGRHRQWGLQPCSHIVLAQSCRPHSFCGSPRIQWPVLHPQGVPTDTPSSACPKPSPVPPPNLCIPSKLELWVTFSTLPHTPNSNQSQSPTNSNARIVLLCFLLSTLSTMARFRFFFLLFYCQTSNGYFPSSPCVFYACDVPTVCIKFFSGSLCPT